MNKDMWPTVLVIAFIAAAVLGIIITVEASSAEDHKRAFKDYRNAVEICASMADTGEELRRCVKEAL